MARSSTTFKPGISGNPGGRPKVLTEESARCIDEDEDEVSRANDEVGGGDGPSYIMREEKVPGGVKETVSEIESTLFIEITSVAGMVPEIALLRFSDL